MSINKYYTWKKKWISIDSVNPKRGGEGAFFPIIASDAYLGCGVKLYFVTKSKNILTQKKIEERHRKILYMVLHQPKQIHSDKYKVCWPIDAVIHNGIVIGFVMPQAFENSLDLYELCQVNLGRKCNDEWERLYARCSANWVVARLKLCTNLASAIHQAHTISRCTIVDLKPKNILITIDGKVSIIDCDSIQISDGKRVLFRSTATTFEYIPPEGNNVNIQSDFIPQSWDLFSLAVIFYQLLTGVHPYTASFSGKYKGLTATHEKVKNSLFVHGSNSQYIYKMADEQKIFHMMPPPMQMLFRRAFENDKFHWMNRPTAEEWGKAFYYYAQHGSVMTMPVTTQKQSIKKKAQSTMKRM